MASNKLLVKHGVLTRGGGSYRAVLDFEAGIAYSYQNPERILAEYLQGKGWVTPKLPEYSSGGWGRYSSGDAEGYHLIHNTRSMIESIKGCLFWTNHEQILSPKEIKAKNLEIKKTNKLIQKRAKQLKAMGIESPELKLLEPLKFQESWNSQNHRNTPKGLDVISIARKYQNALSVFLERKGKPIKADSYLVSRDQVKQGDTVVAFRDSKGAVFLNSQVLQVSSFERDFLGNQSMIQAELRKVAKYSIPFNVLASAGLKLSETQVLEQGPESTHLVRQNTYSGSKIERHFTGALLLENKGRKFLMDIDRREIEHSIFNAFFVEVRSDVQSIAEAYDSMKPQEVKTAEASGLKVLRQGEWFFIETDKTLDVKIEQVKRWGPDKDSTQQVARFDVAHGKGRPNSLMKPVNFGALDELVCGVVTHSGREHAELNLGVEDIKAEVQNNYGGTRTDTVRQIFKLWKLVPNTTVSNFTVTGDVD